MRNNANVDKQAPTFNRQLRSPRLARPVGLPALLLASVLAGLAPVSVWAQPAPVIGQGPGYHDPRSPFKPLQEHEGVLTWSLLSSVTTKADKTRLIPVFPSAVQALDKKTVKVQGFMMPLEPGDKQRHFLLSSVPTSCSFCVPAGPEGLIEVRTKQPVRYSLEPVLVEGVLSVLNDDPYGLFYRLSEGQPLAYKP
ncbi:hypothetical protein DBR47_20595 [Paucibacter sp. KBW04]|uniref:DUF3299 domain-containing protein n=1 Tax=Paucibacter sp. KBW04 TaxID=2153361 RepID=UPI000F577A81|nr:DUF3299 domain-containing protein [Paucibacter sp. KBW04]RQO55280.1 hypothetical protein DBR47_20595 [Paucibacter sp. KBW04]